MWARLIDRAVAGPGGADDVVGAPDGGAYVIASKDTEPDPGSTDMSPDRWVLERRSPTGTLVWRRHGGARCPADTWASSVDAGRQLVAISVYCRGDYRVRAYGPGGRFLWENPLEVPRIARVWNEYSAEVAIGSRGAVFVIASFERPRRPGGSRFVFDLVLEKLSPKGHPVWTRRWRRLHAVGGVDARGTTVVVAGTYDRGNDAWTAELAPSSGLIRWTRRWTGFPVAVSIKPNGDTWVLDEDGVRLIGIAPDGDHLWSRPVPAAGVKDLATFSDGGYVLGNKAKTLLWRFGP